MVKETNNLNRADRISYPVRLLSIDGACRYLSCSSDILEDVLATGEIPVIRLGRRPVGDRDRRKRFVDVRDLDRFIDARKANLLNS